jgi:hypothetical protein
MLLIHINASGLQSFVYFNEMSEVVQKNITPGYPPHTSYAKGTITTDASNINPVARQPQAHLI